MRAPSRPSVQTLFIGLTVAATVAILLEGFKVDLFKSSRIPEDAFACDWFGYLRQARLFRERGIVGGLDTAIRDDLTQYLVSVGKRMGEPVVRWEEGVAPHCHHYVESTDRVILQYPPGTGFIFSFFAEGTQARYGFVVSELIVLSVLLITAVWARVWTVPFLVLALGAVFYTGLFRFSEDWSVPPSGALLLVAGGLTVWLSIAPTSRQRTIAAALVGFVLGLAVDMRILNLFIATGPLGILSFTWLRERRASSLWPLLSAIGGLIVGLAPVFAFNFVNTGHPLRTTYNAADNSLPIFTWHLFAKAFRFYFLNEPFNQVFTLGALLVVPLVVQHRRLALGSVVEAALAGALGFAVSVVYLLTHWILIPYYLFPAAAYATATALFGLVATESAAARRQGASGLRPAIRWALVAVSLLLTILMIRRQVMPMSPLFTESARASTIEPTAIIWGDLGTGNVQYFLRRQSSKLISFTPSMQERFIAEVERDGIRQYLLDDSGTMQGIIGGLVKTGRVRKFTRLFDYDVYIVEPVPTPVSESASR